MKTNNQNILQDALMMYLALGIAMSAVCVNAVDQSFGRIDGVVVKKELRKAAQQEAGFVMYRHLIQ